MSRQQLLFFVCSRCVNTNMIFAQNKNTGKELSQILLTHSENIMSLVPYLLNDLLEDIRRPTLYDQHFGMGIAPLDLASPGVLSVPMRSGYLRPWRHLATADSGVSNVINDKDSFTVNLDVQQFKPEEITVKHVDNFIIVEGKHEEKGDEHGFISRHFVRKYKLPQNCDPDAISVSLSCDGVLQLVAPKKGIEAGSERAIPIMQTNKPAIKPKEAESKAGKMES